MKLAPALMFIGCRSETRDRLYPEEIDEWVRQGVVDVRYAFSKEKINSEGCKYISDRMVHDSDSILNLWRQGARVYVCGSRHVAESVKEATGAIVRDVVKDMDEVEMKKTVLKFQEDIKLRAASDIFD